MAIKKLRGASALALLIGTSATAAFGQQAPQTTTTSQPQAPAPQVTAPPDRTAAAAQEASEGNKVTVTGSLTATTPEDSPKPVEVYSMDDLTQQGTPNVTEFIRKAQASATPTCAASDPTPPSR
jgi:outer membrane receptor protein involved in Fe transport